MAAMDRDGVRPAVLVEAVEVEGRLADGLGRRASVVSPLPDAEAESRVGPDGQIPDGSGSPETLGLQRPDRYTVRARADGSEPSAAGVVADPGGPWACGRGGSRDKTGCSSSLRLTDEAGRDDYLEQATVSRTCWDSLRW